jgi:hypothetical protein
MFDRHLKSGQLSLEDQKHAAWALAVGERPNRADEDFRRPPHRGMLPDVDFDRAVPRPGYRPLLSRIAHFLWGDLRRSPAQPDTEPNAEAELRAALTAVLGERLAAAYIGDDETGGEAIRASIEASPRPDDAAIRIDCARAA